MSGSVNWGVDEFDSTFEANQSYSALFEIPNKRKRTLGNFQTRYLELGQWPEWSPSKFCEVQQKLTQVKTRYRLTKDKISRMSARLQTPCTKCTEVKDNTRSLKLALEEAIQLSYLLLAQVYA